MRVAVGPRETQLTRLLASSTFQPPPQQGPSYEPQEMCYMTAQCPRFSKQATPTRSKSGTVGGSWPGLCWRNCEINSQPPNSKAAPLGKAPAEFKRPAPGLGSKESLDGDRRAQGCGAQDPPGSMPPPSQAHPTSQRAAPAGSSCVQVQQGPNLQKGPRREVPGFPLREELVERKPGVEGFRLHICNSWMSQK